MDALLTVRQVTEALGITRMSLHRMVKSGRFPQPVNIGIRAVRYCESDVEAWLEAQREVQS